MEMVARGAYPMNIQPVKRPSAEEMTAKDFRQPFIHIWGIIIFSAY